MTALSLFATCPLAGCRNLTEHPDQPCRGCLALFGPHIQQTGQPQRPAEEAAADHAARDAEVAQVLTARRGLMPLPEPDPARPAVPEVEWRANQTCWCCEERRKCRPDPDQPTRWICRTCLEIS